MPQPAVLQSVNPPLPACENFLKKLRACLQELGMNTLPPEFEQLAQTTFAQALPAEAEPSAARLYEAEVSAALTAVRGAKKQNTLHANSATEANQGTAEERGEQWARLQKSLSQLGAGRRRAVALQLLGLRDDDSAALLDWDNKKVQREAEKGLRAVQSKMQEAGMPGEVEALTALVQSQPTRADLQRADCLADEFLLRACTGDISEADRLFVADHLSTCRDCAEEFQLARRLKSSERKTAESANTVLPSVTSEATESETTLEFTPKWWQDLIPRFVHYTGFNLFTAAVAGFFLISTLSLATWLIAQHYKHKVQIAQLREQIPPALSETLSPTEPVTPETLQLRVEEAQKQLTDLQTAITEQNADKVLSNQELLGIQNNTLQKELEDLSKPQLDAPVVEIDLATLRKTAEPGKEIVTLIDVPFTSSVFTVILHKPAEKTAPNYLLELFDAKKTKPLWSAQKKLETQTKIALTLAKRNYPAGKYRFTLSGVEGKKKELLETYQIEVKYQPLPKQKKKK